MIDVPVRVKDALRDGRLKKNYRFVVLNDDGSADFTIDNNTLVSESVKFDERMCSGDTLKFGLCEGSSLEFQYFDHPNINGRRIQCFIDVEYMEPSIDVKDETKQAERNGTYTFKSKNNVTTRVEVYFNGGDIPTYYALNELNNYQRDIELSVGDEFYINDTAVVTISVKGGFKSEHTIPMGYFTVEKCPRQASTGIFKITAYNKLQSQYLDTKVNDKIIEIVDSGVWGETSGVDVATILDNLLEGYAIKREEQKLDLTMEIQTPGSSSSSLRETDSQGSSNGWYLHELMLTCRFEIEDFNPSNFYRFKLNCQNIYNASRSYAPLTGSEYFKLVGSSPLQVDTAENWLNGTKSGYAAGSGAQFITTGDTYSVNFYGNNRTKNEYYTPWVTNLMTTGVVIGFVGYYILDSSTSHSWTQAEINAAKERAQEILVNQNNITVEISARSDIEKTLITKADAENLPDVTLRQLQTAVFEINAQYGQIDRVTDLFNGVELNKSRLVPQDTLLPDNALYPNGSGIRGDSSAYSKLWTDNQGTQKFRYLIITYKGLDGDNKAKDMTLQRTINASGNVDYNMSDNWLFKNLIWSVSDVGDYADAMVNKLQDVSWFPFEMWCAGLPYLETGDEIEITNDEGTYISYILQRQLQGIQNLQDTFINGTLDVF